MPRFALLLLAATASCAPTRVIERNDDVQTGQRTRTLAGHDRKTVATVRADDDEATITLQSRETCDQFDERVLHRTRVVERHASVGTQVLFYLAAAAGLGTGAGILGDVPNIPASNDPMTQNPVGQTGATVIGAIQLAVGATCLALGIGTSIRGRTSETDQRTVYSMISDSGRSIECGVHVIASEPVALVAGDARVQVGRSDARGKVVVTWETLGPLFSKNASSTAQVVVQDEAVATVELDAARAFWANRARERALELAQADSVDEAAAQADRAATFGADVSKVREAIARAPTSRQRREEAERKAREEQERNMKLASEHLSNARAKLKRGDIDTAGSELDSARELGADVTALQAEVDRRAEELVVRKARAMFAQCRKVSRARDQFDRVSQCDADCQRIRRHIEGDWERLSREHLDFSSLSPERTDELKEQCQTAGCPECP
jgi:hypothetical protein